MAIEVRDLGTGGSLGNHGFNARVVWWNPLGDRDVGIDGRREG